MAQYAFAFDLDTVAMKDNGLSDAECVRIYQTEIPHALQLCGFTRHEQESIYATDSTDDQLIPIVTLQATLAEHAPSFHQYAKRVHVFRFEEWSDLTALLTEKEAAVPFVQG